jgi:hypothetical protein
MLQRTIAILAGVGLCLLAVLLTTTTPATAGPFGVLVIFISAYLVFLGFVSFFLYGVWLLISKLSVGFGLRRPLEPLPFRRSYYYSTIIAAAPVMLIGLQSVGAISIYELILVAIFVVLGCVYISKRIY